MGRPVEFVVYDDQSNPSTVPGIYTKLLDVDKVDLIVSGYGTNVIAPAMPVIIQHNLPSFRQLSAEPFVLALVRADSGAPGILPTVEQAFLYGCSRFWINPKPINAASANQVHIQTRAPNYTALLSVCPLGRAPGRPLINFCARNWGSPRMGSIRSGVWLV